MNYSMQILNKFTFEKHLHHPKCNLTQGKAVKLQAMTSHSAVKIYGARFPRRSGM
jgi:hypothetical protein